MKLKNMISSCVTVDKLDNVVNILLSAMKPRMFPVMLHKLYLRMFCASAASPVHADVNWIKQHCESIEDFALSVDPELWKETLIYLEKFQEDAEKILSNVTPSLGGGGCHPLLYFLVRLLRPDSVVETGVAAGYSSHAILSAMRSNETGQLFSSDFPYFRITNAEQYVGILVPPELRDRWTLLLDGDRSNIPKIVGLVDKVDLLHYDSDKSVQGRKYVLEKLEPFFHERSVIVIDDIHNNSHFRKYVERQTIKKWRVYEYNGKYLGILYGDAYLSLFGHLPKLGEDS